MPELPSSSRNGPKPEELLAHVFPTARRGVDPEAVRLYLAELADALLRAQEREAELTERLALAERPVTPQPLDAAALSAAVGQETARVLQVAHEAADDVLARATAEADAVRSSAASLVEDERRKAEALAATITAAAAGEAERLVNEAREECRAMVEVARAARQRILADLGTRRRELHVQLEQLRAGKDALADVVDAVASYVVHSVEELKDQLAGAEEHARLAADAVASAPAAFVLELSEEGLLAEAAALVSEGEPAAPELPALEVELVEVELLEGADGGANEGDAASEAAHEDGVEDEASDAGSAAAEAGSEETSNAIDELFAKIRQSREEQVERARSVLEDATVDEPPTGEVPATPEAPATAEASGTAEPSDPSPEPAPADAAADAAPATPVAEGEAGEEATTAAEEDELAAGAVEGVEPDEEWLAARDGLLAASTTELTRVLKRQLRLEQNQLLDAFRNLKKGADPLSLLPATEMSDRLEHDVRDALVAAFAAGRGFAANSISRDPGPLRQPVAAVNAVAAALGTAVVEPIRRRVEEGLSGAGEEPAVAIGAAFREWKGAGAEQVAADFAVRAFSAGVLEQARASGNAVAWIVDDGDQRCPDCDDNAIAGAQPPGQPFPTGHEHPPIHPGCRCLLVLSPA